MIGGGILDAHGTILCTRHALGFLILARPAQLVSASLRLLFSYSMALKWMVSWGCFLVGGNSWVIMVLGGVRLVWEVMGEMGLD